MQMKLKDSYETSVEVGDDGRIDIYQFDSLKQEQGLVSLTPEQFKSIENWVFKNKDEIELAWNGGVDDEIDS